jgi:hypothetical protein
LEQPPTLQPQSMADAQAQIRSGSMNNNMSGFPLGANNMNNMGGGVGHTAGQQQYFMQQMAQMQAQQQQRQQAQQQMGANMGGVFPQQIPSSHGGFGGDAAAGGLTHPGQQMGQNSFLNSNNNNDSSAGGAPGMVPLNVMNPSGAPLDADSQAQQDRLLQQQQLLQQQHQKLLEQQELLRQLQEQQRLLQEQQQAVNLQQQQQGMVGAGNMNGAMGMSDFPGVPVGIGGMNPSTMQNIQQQQPPPLPQQQQVGGGDGQRKVGRRGSLTFDDLVKGIKSAKAAQKMGMSSTNMSLSVGDIDSNLSSAFEDSLIISVEGSLANSSNSDGKKAAASGGAGGGGGGHVAPIPENTPSQMSGPGGVPENVTLNPQQQQQQQPGHGPMGESSMLRGMAMSDAGMSFSLTDAADLLGGSAEQIDGFSENKLGDQAKVDG